MEKTTKRYLALVLVLALVCSVLPTGALATQTDAVADDPVAISLWTYPIGGWGNEDTVNALIADFEAAYPGISVSVEYLDYMNGDNKVSTAIAAGAAPDLILEGPERLVANWGEKGYMADLSGLLDETDISEIYSNALAAGYGSDGNLYEYPLAGTVHVMAINKAVFEEAGAMQYLNEETRTWNSAEAFFAAVQAVYEYTGTTVGTVYCGSKGGDQGTRALINNLYGGTFTNSGHTAYTWDSEENIAALQALYDCEGIAFDATIAGGNEISMFYNGELNMSFCWNIAQQQNPGMAGTGAGLTASGDEIMFVAFPSDGDPQLCGGIWGFGVFDNGDDARVEAAKTFVKFMCDSAETVEAVQASGYFAVRDTAEGTDLSSVWADGTVEKEYSVMMPMLGDYYVVASNWAEARDCWVSMLQEITVGKDIAGTVKYWNDSANGTAKTKLDVLTVQYGADTAAWWQQFEQDFEAAHESIDLVLECVSWNDVYSTVETRIAAGQAPDILNIDGYQSYKDSLLPVQDYMSETTYAKFPDCFLSESEEDGTVWAVPDLASARTLYYNADILEAVGASVPTTWEELEQVCAAIKEYYGNEVIPWGLDVSSNEGQAAFALYAWANGGGFVDADGNWNLNSDENVAAIEFAAGLYNNGYTNGTDLTRYDIMDQFVQGQVAMTIAADSFASSLDGVNYGVAAIPANEGKTAHSIGVMDRFMAFDNNHSDEELAAVTAFFDFFYDDARYTQWVQMEGFMPATISGMELIAEEDTSMEVWVDVLESCKFYPAGKSGWSTVRSGVIDVLEQVLAGGDVRQLLDELQGGLVMAEGSCGESTYWILTYDGTLSISGEGVMDSYSSANGQPWHDYGAAITQVVVEGTVSEIGAYAFYGLDNLVSVTVEEGVEGIRGHSMKYCPKLASVSIPSTVTSMGVSTFYGSDLLTTAGPAGGGYAIEFGWSETIPSYAFDSMDQLVSVELPDTLKVIEDHAFVLCSNLIAITLPDGLTSIGDLAFEQTGLTSVVIPNSVTEIGSEVFEYAPLTEVTLSENLTVIPYKAFSNCTKLTAIVIPEAVTEIGTNAFSGCTALTSIVIPAAVSKVGAESFENCTALETITFEGDAPTFGTAAFDGVTATVYYLADNETWTEDVMQQYGGTITWEFYVPVIAEGASENITWTLYENGYLTIEGEGMMDTIGWHEYSEYIRSVYIGDGITSIAAYAFQACSNLTRVDIPDSVTHIYDEAFWYCNLTGIDLPAGLAWVGEYAFFGAGALGSIVIPESVTFIGSNAFTYTSISSITFIGDAPAIDSDAFTNVATTAYYPADNKTWTADVMQCCTNFTWVPYYSVFEDGTDTEIMQGEEAEIHIDADHNALVDVYLDGTLVDPSNYTVTVGSTIITFHADFLATLEAGDHQVTVNFEEGSAFASITISVPGDLNLDGKVDSDDLTMLARHVGGIEAVEDKALANADVNGDGKVNSDDLTKHARYVGGIITDWNQE